MKIVKNQNLDEETLAGMTKQERDWVYNALDCCVTLEIFNHIRPNLDPVTLKTYEFSKALQAPVLEMTMRGILVDQGQRDKVVAEYTEQIERVASNLDRIISEGIGAVGLNWRSPKQLITLMYDVMGAKPIRKRNAKGQLVPTVDREALEKLTNYRYIEPLVNHILLLRDIDKKRTWLKTGADRDGRMRSNYNIAGTNTGRLSSSTSDFGTGINAQNIDRSLRTVFVADSGMKFANLDLEQGDSRNVGAICWNLFVESHGEAFAGSYLDACESGDLHTKVSQLIWSDLGWTDDPKENKKIAEQIFYRQDSYRQMSKKGGHGTNYFGTAPTMAMHLKVPTPLIKDFQAAYFGAFPVIGQADHGMDKINWHNHVRSQLRATGTITTLLGRRRRFFGRPDEDETLRAAIAFEPQSLTAEEINIGMLKLWRTNRVQLLAQVHDSILFQYPEELEDEIVPLAIETLKVWIELKRGRKFLVPVDAKVGWNWGDQVFDKDGNLIGNIDGLAKWKGHDIRTRSFTPSAKEFSLF